jgi:hypothetical protein
MKMRRVSEDTLSLSFTDVLTCVLGAAIAIFLIFVALITLSGSEGALEGGAKGYSSAKLKSIQEKINRGFATSTVKIISDNHYLIEQVIVSSARDNRLKNVSRLRIEDSGAVLLGVQFDFFGNLPEFRIEALPASITSVDKTLVIGFVTVGGMSKCIKYSVTPRSFADKSNAPLFRLGPNVRFFLDSRYEHELC